MTAIVAFVRSYLHISAEGFRRYFANTSWLFMERVISLSITLAMGIWMTNYLGDQEFGLFQYSRSFATIIMTIAPLGIDSLLAHRLFHHPDQKNKILGTALIIRIGGALICLSLILAANQLAGHNAQTTVLVMVIAAAALLESFNIVGQFFSSRILSKYHVYAEVTKTTVSALMKAVLILNKAPLVWFALVLIVENLVYAAIALSIYSIKFESVFRWRPDLRYVKGLLSDSWPLGLSGLVVMVYMKIDQVIIKYLLGDEAVGHYAAALRLSESSYFIPTVICASLLPSILSARKNGKEFYHQRLQKLFTLLVFIALLIAIPVTFFGNDIVRLLFKDEFAPAGDVLVIHIWTGIFASLGIASSGWFVAEKLQKLTLYRTLFGVVLNIILNFLLIPPMGINGSALATLISQVFASYLINFINPRTRELFILQTKALTGIDPVRKVVGRL